MSNLCSVICWVISGNYWYKLSSFVKETCFQWSKSFQLRSKLWSLSPDSPLHCTTYIFTCSHMWSDGRIYGVAVLPLSLFPIVPRLSLLISLRVWASRCAQLLHCCSWLRCTPVIHYSTPPAVTCAPLHCSSSPATAYSPSPTWNGSNGSSLHNP